MLYFALNLVAFPQVDTAYIFNYNMPYGTLDIRIAKSPTEYFYLQEDQTFSFRESAPGVKTNTYLDMTSWDSSPYKEGHLGIKTDTGDQFIMNYRFLVPPDYNPSLEEGYPIILMFHGYGERGNCEDELCYHGDRTYVPGVNIPPAPTTVDHELLNNDHNLLHGAKEHLAAVNRAGGKLPGDPTLDPKAFPGFVLFPQNLNGWDQWAVQDAIRILRLVIKKYNIDENRVYVMGLSNGGMGLYDAIKRAPWLFTAGIAMSAINDASINNLGMAEKVAHIPLWLFQGGRDINPYPGKTERYIEQFRNAGVTVRYTLYPELGHGTWNTAFREPDFYSWLLGKTKSNIHSFVNSEVICSDEGTRLEMAEGFHAYQWQLDGELIADANGPVYFAKTPGTYQGRFSRVSDPSAAQWNPWSEPLTLTVEEPPQAAVEQKGTVLLKDLNGAANAVLKSATTHAQYFWYKDGKLLDLPGNDEDTLQTVVLKPSYGNGAYTLVVSDYGCLSEPSAPKHIFFNDQAPTNITAPGNFTAVSSLSSEVVLDWNDASQDEGGFEIWRRRKLNATSYGPWEMATLMAANGTTYTDTGLIPESSYQYKIRAVSNAGRSDYTPSGDGVLVETILDTEIPGAPTSLKAVSNGIQTVSLSWSPSSDNTRIREYHIFINDDDFISTASPDTTFVLTGMPLNQEFEISVKGVDLSNNISEASNTVDVSTFYSGLYYEHSTGSWPDLDSIDWTHAEFTGSVKDFTLSERTQDDYYNFKFDGFILIENAGAYQFRTTSNDGSRILLNGDLIVDNDGIHDLETVTSGNQNLDKGPQRITVYFFEYTQSDTLVVEYMGPDTGNEWTTISYQVLKSDDRVITAVGPDNGPEDSFQVNVYPNPATQNNINVQVLTVSNTPVRVKLLDPVGRNLFEGRFDPLEIAQGINILPPGVVNTGMYVVMVMQGNIRIQQKVIIRR